MRILGVLMILIGLCSNLNAQQYPIKTIFKRDSVVLLKTGQFNQLNALISFQEKRIKDLSTRVASLKIEIDRLSQSNELISNQLQFQIAERPRAIDSAVTASTGKLSLDLRLALAKINLMDDWMLETAVGNAYLYFDWKDSTVKAIDLTLYSSEFDHDVGNLTFIRRGSIAEYPELRKRLWQYPESPDPDWYTVKSPELRPIVYNYPHKIRVKNAFLGEFMKNPYIKR
jgi:uncharacterized coiled-coil protein SlyX